MLRWLTGVPRIFIPCSTSKSAESPRQTTVWVTDLCCSRPARPFRRSTRVSSRGEVFSWFHERCGAYQQRVLLDLHPRPRELHVVLHQKPLPHHTRGAPSLLTNILLYPRQVRPSALGRHLPPAPGAWPPSRVLAGRVATRGIMDPSLRKSDIIVVSVASWARQSQPISDHLDSSVLRDH